MAWIECHQALREHRKTKKLARRLGTSIPTTIGHLIMLWWWAMDYAEDGNLTKFDPDDIADGVSWDGSVNFLEAAHDAGFIDYIDGEYHIHDWYTYIGRLLDKKEANKLRMREARAKNVQRTTSARSTLPNQTVPNHTEPYQELDRLIDDRPTVPIETNKDKPESFYNAHHRIFGYYCNNFQIEQLGKYIDEDGMEESVIVRALERAATAKSAYNFKFILGILNGYLKSKVKTLLEAIALDEEFERGLSFKEFKGNGTTNRQGTSKKPQIPIISDSSPPSKPLSPERRAFMFARASRLDGKDISDEELAILEEKARLADAAVT